ncbi:MAG: 50S ribosomal protein L19 [Candidatus Shikimatogenerans sp. AspAUS03]|uniref:Large ribosomal subunit protein bL19 n=1 Tax=Candidatus Shikimatogenerans sp. AspAUS03 TaxID=3158563 RepID=A0AAU7QSB7_9FLAO
MNKNFKIGDNITVYYYLYNKKKIYQFIGYIIKINKKKKKKNITVKNIYESIIIKRIFFLKQKNILKIIVNNK